MLWGLNCELRKKCPENISLQSYITEPTAWFYGGAGSPGHIDEPRQDEPEVRCKTLEVSSSPCSSPRLTDWLPSSSPWATGSWLHHVAEAVSPFGLKGPCLPTDLNRLAGLHFPGSSPVSSSASLPSLPPCPGSLSLTAVMPFLTASSLVRQCSPQTGPREIIALILPLQCLPLPVPVSYTASRQSSNSISQTYFYLQLLVGRSQRLQEYMKLQKSRTSANLLKVSNSTTSKNCIMQYHFQKKKNHYEVQSLCFQAPVPQ